MDMIDQDDSDAFAILFDNHARLGWERRDDARLFQHYPTAAPPPTEPLPRPDLSLPRRRVEAAEARAQRVFQHLPARILFGLLPALVVVWMGSYLLRAGIVPYVVALPFLIGCSYLCWLGAVLAPSRARHRVAVLEAHWRRQQEEAERSQRDATAEWTRRYEAHNKTETRRLAGLPPGGVPSTPCPTFDGWICTAAQTTVGSRW